MFYDTEFVLLRAQRCSGDSHYMRYTYIRFIVCLSAQRHPPTDDNKKIPLNMGFFMVPVVGFELTT